MMELRPKTHRVLLFLGIVLAGVPQLVALEEQVPCNETQYQNDKLNRCCNHCPPGHHMIKPCTLSSETECQPCGNRSFATNWNHAPKCRRCSYCNKNLVMRAPCNATQGTVCGCPDGYYCTQYGALDVCQICLPIPRTDPTVSIQDGPPADMKNIWIILGVLLFMVTAIVAIVCLKTRLLKRFGRMIKNKGSSESSPQPEIAVDFAVVGAVNEGPISPLLNGPYKMPMQEVGKPLGYPVQVSDGTDVGECSLLAK